MMLPFVPLVKPPFPVVPIRLKELAELIVPSISFPPELLLFLATIELCGITLFNRLYC